MPWISMTCWGFWSSVIWDAMQRPRWKPLSCQPSPQRHAALILICQLFWMFPRNVGRQVTSSYIKLQSLDSRRKTWRPHTLFACPIQESSWWALVTSIFQSALRKHVGIQLYKIILLSAEMECVWKCIPHPSVHHHFPSFLMVIFRVILFGPNFRQRCAKQTGLPQDAEAAVRRSRSGVAAVTGPHGGREGGSRISNDLWIRSLDPTFLVRFSSCFHVFSQDETVYFGFGDSADDWYRWWRWQVGRVRRGEFNDRTRAMGITGADASVIKWHWLPC